MKILLIDDDEALKTVFSTALQQAGFTVVSAGDGQNGIEKAKSEKPNLILLDQVLPDMKGNNALKTLKTDPETQKIPVAMLSNFGQQELIREAINTGAMDYILKYQIEPTDLVSKVKGFLAEKSTSV
ncbi:MAG: response regulator [Candidatus Levybacteria bacterium]|nr:response regulator [Candidatus Levybacteria bacterium]